MRARAHGARQRLPVDVALIDEPEPAVEKHRPEIAQRRAGLDARRRCRDVVIDDARNMFQRNDGAVAFD